MILMIKTFKSIFRAKFFVISYCLIAAPLSWAQSQSSIPRFELDPFWPQVPMNENWLTGGLGGMCMGQRDEVYL